MRLTVGSMFLFERNVATLYNDMWQLIQAKAME